MDSYIGYNDCGVILCIGTTLCGVFVSIGYAVCGVIKTGHTVCRLGTVSLLDILILRLVSPLDTLWGR